MIWRKPRGRPPQSLSSGNIVTIALELYRSQGNRHFLLSLFAHAWFFLISLGVMVGLLIFLFVSAIAAGVSQSPVGFIIIFGLGLLVACPFFFYGLARFTASGGLISRRILSTLEQNEETEETARTYIFPRTLTFLWSNLWAGSILILVYALLGLFLYVMYLGLWPIVQSLEFLDLSEGVSAVLITAFILFIIILLVGCLFVISYISARLALADAILAIEPECSALQAIQRSWQLTQGQAWHTLTVFFIASILVVPANIVAGIVNSLVIIPVAGFFVGVLLFPLWQGIKTVMYVDLRVRNEGAGFAVRRSIAPPMRWLRRVCLQTPESIELDFALAGIGSRVLAWLLDQLILYVTLFLVSFLVIYLYLFGLLPFLTEAFSISDDTLNLWALSFYLLGMFFIYNGYYIYFETLWQGQTPGKRFAEIRVVQDNGRPIGLREATLRSLLQSVDFTFFGIGAFLIALTKSEKRLGDMAAGTLVIQDEQATRQAPQQQAVSPEAKELAQWLGDRPGVDRVTGEQYLMVRNFLSGRQRLSPSGRYRSAQELREQLEPMIFGDTPHPSIAPRLEAVAPEVFIEAIYLAYRVLHQTPSGTSPQDSRPPS
ncbi:RDD family protein [Candidatus Synechococcus calcipolaris G9]|uniref:RDD family protein n=1 Tax=Candidatus Synechococcus calcipolaris G9 TaxID=1497997 RepID=A0ABT6EVP7_9SYNE|nr:RDD family protein [Candidatus Synechococcus calcipolaris]MDG2989879.1 RDD family protein [Candidatus Synechococcus calcipolaris G9]